jgi:hypothetical protein
MAGDESEIRASGAGGSARAERAERGSAARRPDRAARRSPGGRSPARATLLIVGGVLVGVAVLVAILSSVGSSGTGTSATTSSSASSARAGGAHSTSHARRVSTEAGLPAASPAETSVVVLNGTATEGLAHAISANLRQSGYTQATALNGRPPGANQVTVVEYTAGHLTDAQGVARSLAVTRVQPIESATASLSGSATVVVVVGLDKAATVP